MLCWSNIDLDTQLIPTADTISVYNNKQNIKREVVTFSLDSIPKDSPLVINGDKNILTLYKMLYLSHGGYYFWSI